MKNSLQTTQTNKRYTFHITCLLAVCFCATSCLEPQDKPIPKLDPSLSTAEVTAPAIEAPITPGTITRMPVGNLYQLVQGKAALIFDVRPTLFYKMGNIPNSISFPRANFDKDIEKQEPLIKTAIKNQTPVVVYCTDLACPDALAVATLLSQRGHHISVLQGGYDAWKSATD